jgi:pimeloyl-ACP methyl ester carboxylesterase
MAKRGIGWTGLFLVLTSCVLGLFFGPSARADSEFADLPPPGRLVDVDRHQLHFNCTGAGTPTVILEEGAGGGSLNWTWIQRKIAATTHVCSYDRPGHAWSSSTETPRDAETVSRELDALLKAAGEKGPFIAVGHSLGGPYARMFAAQQGRNVIGLVLVDGTNPSVLATAGEVGLSPTIVSGVASFIASNKALFEVADRIGLVKGIDNAGWNDLPPDVVPAMQAISRNHETWRSTAREMASVPETLSQVGRLDSLGAMPVVVIAADRWVDMDPDTAATRAEWNKKQQRNWLNISSNSRFLIVPESDHESLLRNKKHADAVSGAIIRLVQSVRRR